MGKHTAISYIVTHQDGCNLHPACLSCPFEHCQFDGALFSPYYEERRKRNAAIRALRGKALPEQIAQQFGISERSLYKIWQGEGQ